MTGVSSPDPRHDDLIFGTLDVHATDEETLVALHAYGDAWSTAFLEGRLDEEKRKRWLAHSREDDVTFRFASPRTTVAGASRPVATFLPSSLPSRAVKGVSPPAEASVVSRSQ